MWQGLYRTGKRCGLQCSFSDCENLPNCALTIALRLLRKPAQRYFRVLLWQGLYRTGMRCVLYCFGSGFSLMFSGLRCSISDCRSLLNCAMTIAIRLLRKPAQRYFRALLR